jgi:hypothetical protein
MVPMALQRLFLQLEYGLEKQERKGWRWFVLNDHFLIQLPIILPLSFWRLIPDLFFINPLRSGHFRNQESGGRSQGIRNESGLLIMPPSILPIPYIKKNNQHTDRY